MIADFRYSDSNQRFFYQRWSDLNLRQVRGGSWRNEEFGMGIGEWGCLNCDFRLIGLMGMIFRSGGSWQS